MQLGVALLAERAHLLVHGLIYRKLLFADVSVALILVAVDNVIRVDVLGLLLDVLKVSIDLVFLPAQLGEQRLELILLLLYLPVQIEHLRYSDFVFEFFVFQATIVL